MTPPHRTPLGRTRPKPQAADEAARVLLVWQMLYDEFRPFGGDLPMGDRLAILAVAERIAARTEG